MGRKSNTREILLEVAFNQIWSQSYGTVSVDQICGKARVQKGSLYHFFPSKSELACAALEQHWQNCLPTLHQIFAPGIPPLERIRNYCGAIIELQTREFNRTGQVPGCPFASAGSELSRVEECVRKKSVEVFDQISHFLESALRDAIQDGTAPQQDPAAASHAVIAYVTGVVLHAKMKNNLQLMEPMPEIVMQILLGKRKR